MMHSTSITQRDHDADAVEDRQRILRAEAGADQVASCSVATSASEDGTLRAESVQEA